MSSHCPPPLDMQITLPWIHPQPPTPPPAGRPHQALNAPNTPIHRQNPQLGYDACWRRILESLNQNPGSLDAFIFLLELVEESFRHFEFLAVEAHYRLVVDHNGTDLALAMPQELWAELKNCRMRGHGNDLRVFLRRQQHLLSSQPSPLRQSVARGQHIGASPPSPDQLRHRSSQRSPHSNRSRTPSIGSSATSDSGDCEREYWCPLVAQNYCKQKPFKKWGNAKNHVAREHQWYTDDRPDWQSELKPVDSFRGPADLEPLPCSPGEADFGQLGTSFHAQDIAPEQFFGTSSGSNPQPQHHPRLLQRKPVPASAAWTSPAGLSSNTVVNQPTIMDENQDILMDDLISSHEFAGTMMYTNTISGQLDINPFQFGEMSAVNSVQQRSPTRPSPWLGLRNSRARSGIDNRSGHTGQ